MVLRYKGSTRSQPNSCVGLVWGHSMVSVHWLIGVTLVGQCLWSWSHFLAELELLVLGETELLGCRVGVTARRIGVAWLWVGVTACSGSLVTKLELMFAESESLACGVGFAEVIPLMTRWACSCRCGDVIKSVLLRWHGVEVAMLFAEVTASSTMKFCSWWSQSWLVSHS